MIVAGIVLYAGITSAVESVKKIWFIIRGKDYCYSDTVMSKADFEEFKKYVNQF